ncbi:MAG: hypothetical protein OEY97_05690 [Nitrospirota bacterium]|nr:hypothetical protein [Nitrospirota bacterium]
MKYLPFWGATALALILFSAAPAKAQRGDYDYTPSINYTYLEVGLEAVDYNGGNESGLLLKGSMVTAEFMRVLGEIAIGSGDDFFGYYDYTDLTVGLGGFTSLSSEGTTIDWTAAYLHLNWSDAFGSVTNTGYYLDGGFRTMVAPNMELNGGLRYREVEGFDSRWIRLGMVIASPVTGHGFSFEYLTSDAPSDPTKIRLCYRIHF